MQHIDRSFGHRYPLSYATADPERPAVCHPFTVQDVAALRDAALSAVAAASDTSTLREVENRFLGKNGEITGLLKQMGSVPANQKREFGGAVNGAKNAVAEAVEARGAQLKAAEQSARFESERIDPTMPSRPSRGGLLHPLQQTTDKIVRVLGGLGFKYVESPELEDFWYNFGALNYPPDHPAMDDQDTFYVDDDHVLRTQCTAFQGRLMEVEKPPIRAFTVGRTYRNEAVDRTHGHTFHQVDCLMVDEGVSMAHLKGTLGAFARAMFGDEVKVRFRPDFFPFVEPGVDYAISTPKLFNGRWVELGGAGLVHPNILERYGIDTERYSGFAFGLGVERIPMMAYGVDDLRHFMENDIRFLKQFSGEPV
ncbi:phenylalanine--tRNA ligase subunit alpha [bacterium]|nr:MAG: phenylalanine--tRNA ligase subunit alpha [bacterium]